MIHNFDVLIPNFDVLIPNFIRKFLILPEISYFKVKNTKRTSSDDVDSQNAWILNHLVAGDSEIFRKIFREFRDVSAAYSGSPAWGVDVF